MRKIDRSAHLGREPEKAEMKEVKLFAGKLKNVDVGKIDLEKMQAKVFIFPVSTFVICYMVQNVFPLYASELSHCFQSKNHYILSTNL